MKTNIFDRISFVSLFLVIVLLPVFFLPFTNIPIETSKGLLLVVGLTVSVICWGLARFFDGKITLPRSATLLAGGGVVLAFLLSASFMKDSEVAFFGTMFDVGTFWFIFAAFLLMFMSSIILRDPKKAKIVLFGSILSGAVLLVFQAVRLLLPDILSLGVLASKSDNLLGSWNALGIFAGFSALMSLLIVEFFPTTKVEKRLLQALAVLSMIVIAAVNFQFVWQLLGIFALIIFVYKISISLKEKNTESASNTKDNFPVFSFVIIMVTLLFFMSARFIGGILPNYLEVPNIEVNPSFNATMGVTKSVLTEHPMFGMGPNKFGAAWAMYKPININNTINGNEYWGTTFNSSSGLIPTFAATTGAVGILTLLTFFILLIVAGVKSIFSSIKNGSNWETMAFFVLSLYLFVSCFFYSAGAVVFLLALAFAGIFIGLSSSLHHKGEISFSYLNDHRKSFFSILFIVIMLIAAAAVSFKYIERLVSVSYFSKAVTASDISLAESSISKALTFHQNDLYLRTYAQVYLVKLNSIVAKDATTLSDEDKATLQSSLEQAVSGAQLAINYDPTNYLNHQALGSIYQRLASVGVKDVYSKSIESYAKASALNPKNPGIKLNMASVSMADKKVKEAKEYASAAVALKPDYIDAYIILSQIAKEEGDNAAALSYAQTALSISPTNKDLIKYADSFKVSTPAPTSDSIKASTTTKKK